MHTAEEISAAMQRINDRLATQARQEDGRAVFVCECGYCGGAIVPISLEDFDELRAREEPVLSAGH